MPENKQVTPWMIQGLILGGLILIVSALIGFLWVNRPKVPAGAENNGPLRVGMRLPDFTLQDIHGKTVKLSDYAGKATILVNAWATWCPPCKAEMPALNTFYQQNREKDFVILAVNAGESPSTAADFASANNLQFPVLLDPQEDLMDQLGIHDFPTSILIGKDGLIKTIHVGMFTQDTLKQEILPSIQ